MKNGRVLVAGSMMFTAAMLAAVVVNYSFQATGLTAPQRTTADLATLLEPSIQFAVPDGDGPFPAIILFHGCGGRQPVFSDYAELARSNGVIAVVPDSFSPRAMPRAIAYPTVCAGAALQGHERAGDVAAVLAWTRAQPDVDASRIALAGWSHGGWAIMDLLTMDLASGERPTGLVDAPPRTFEGVESALLFYPYCRPPARARDHPLLDDMAIETVMGGADIVSGQGACASIFDRERGMGREVREETWAGLTHGFDDPDLPALSPNRYNAAGAVRAADTFVDFIKRRLTDEPPSAAASQP